MYVDAGEGESACATGFGTRSEGKLQDVVPLQLTKTFAELVAKEDFATFS